MRRRLRAKLTRKHMLFLWANLVSVERAMRAKITCHANSVPKAPSVKASGAMQWSSLVMLYESRNLLFQGCWRCQLVCWPAMRCIFFARLRRTQCCTNFPAGRAVLTWFELYSPTICRLRERFKRCSDLGRLEVRPPRNQACRQMRMSAASAYQTAGHLH